MARRRGGGPSWLRRWRFGLLMGLAIVLLLAAYVWVLDYSRPHVTGDALRYDTFVSLARDGRIDTARILDQDAYIVGEYVREDGTTAEYNAPLIRGTQGDLASLLVDEEIATTVDQQVLKRVMVLGSYLIPTLVLILLFVYLIVSYRRGSGLFGITSGARKHEPGDTGVTFADVAGQDAAVAELAEIRDFLSEPERFTSLGAQVPKGVLLYGPPGCGKTLLARALAGEAGASFYSISGSDFVEVYVGVGAARVRDLFAQARENTPALVFIDELDSVGRSRGGSGPVTARGEQEQALNQILAEMDGFSTSQGIVVVGATNRPDVLDPALLRPGRFDRTVGLERPDEAARLQILQVHARDKRLARDVDLPAVAAKALGLTGADLANVLNEGALLAGRAGKSAVSQTDLEAALRRILEAPERQKRLSLRERNVGRRFSSQDKVTFDDVAGADDAVAELAEVRDFLVHPDRYAEIGARVPRGILLSGPPGVGKTLLARAVAGEANAAFISVAGSEFVEVFVGEGAARVRELFAEARSLAPAIVFVDEIDAIGGRRAAAATGGGHREREQTLNQILVELDGFEERTAVIVMAATNRPDILDPALVRPGRFDRQVTVGLPDRAGRRAILELYADGKHLSDDVDLDAVAGLTQGFSGADLANVLNEAALLTARRGKQEIAMDAVEEGVDRARLGVASRAVILSEEERRIVAYHEAGHALAALALEHASPPHKLSIVSRGATLGRCDVMDTHDRVIATRAGLVDRMAVALAGRVAEQQIFGQPSSGSAADLEHAGDLAVRMVRQFAMTDVVKPRTYPESAGEGRQPSYSPELTRQLETAVDDLLDEAEQRARQALADPDVLERVAETLLERETLTAAELEQLATTTPLRKKQPRKAGTKTGTKKTGSSA